MDLTTCSVCVLAGSAGGAVTAFYTGRRHARRPQGAGGPPWSGQTMRSWPGGRHRERRVGDGGAPGAADGRRPGDGAN